MSLEANLIVVAGVDSGFDTVIYIVKKEERREGGDLPTEK